MVPLYFGAIYISFQKLTYIRSILTEVEINAELPCSAMCQNIRDILEELRIRMHMDMTEEMGIPALDPFEMDRIHLSLADLDLGE